MKKVAVLLAEGFEESEAVVPADILRRMAVDVTLVGVGGRAVPGAHGIEIGAETTLDRVGLDDFSCVILPGGLPGAYNLRDNPKVIQLIRNVHFKGGIVAAICAAPIVLAKAGLASGRRVTGYPGTDVGTSEMKYTGEVVEVDDRIVTARGPGAAYEFGFAIGVALGIPKEKVDIIGKGMLVKR